MTLFSAFALSFVPARRAILTVKLVFPFTTQKRFGKRQKMFVSSAECEHVLMGNASIILMCLVTSFVFGSKRRLIHFERPQWILRVVVYWAR